MGTTRPDNVVEWRVPGRSCSCLVSVGEGDAAESGKPTPAHLQTNRLHAVVTEVVEPVE